MIAATDVGFAPPVANHALKHTGTNNRYSYTYEEFECSCGYKVQGTVTQKGKMDARCLRNWRDHVNATNLVDEISAVGVIQKKRVRWDIFVLSRAYSGAADFVAPGTRFHNNDWLNPPGHTWVFSNPWAVAISKSSGRKYLDSSYSTSRAALERARKLLMAAEARGETVYWGQEAQMDAPAITPRLSLMEFVTIVDDALESTKLTKVRDTLERLDQFMDAVPVLQAKRQQLADHHDKIITMGMDLGIETAEEEGSDPQDPE